MVWTIHWNTIWLQVEQGRKQKRTIEIEDCLVLLVFPCLPCRTSTEDLHNRLVINVNLGPPAGSFKGRDQDHFVSEGISKDPLMS